HTLCCSFTVTSPSRLSPLSLHDALPIFRGTSHAVVVAAIIVIVLVAGALAARRLRSLEHTRRGLDLFWAGAFTYVGTYAAARNRSEEHTSELQSRGHLVCRLLLEKKKTT